MPEGPKFPITVEYSDQNEHEVFDNEEELACTLEWFDSEDSEYHAKVTDALDRKVRLVVRKLQIEKFEIE